MFYVYKLINPSSENPFYIGVGKEGRKSSIRREYQHIRDAVNWKLGKKIRKPNRHKFNTILKILDENKEVLINICSYFENEKSALQLEMFLIYLFGRKDLGTGILTNMTDGGEGVLHWSEESKKKMSERLKGKPSPLKGRKLGSYSEERKNNISKSSIGRKSNQKGKTWEEIFGIDRAIELRKFHAQKAKDQFSGKTSHRKGKSNIYSKNTIEKLSEASKRNDNLKKYREQNPNPWNKGKTLSSKGKTYEELYGLEKANELKELRRKQKEKYWKEKFEE